MANTGYGVQSPDATPLTALEGLISQLTYQLDRLSDNTADYYEVTERLSMSPKSEAGKQLDDLCQGGHIHKLQSLMNRFETLNDNNKDLLSKLKAHI